MKSGVKPSAGFTIIEVIIVFGVSAALLASAIALMSGRLSDTEFNQSVNDFNSQVASIIDDVGDSTSSPLLDGQVICSYETLHAGMYKDIIGLSVTTALPASPQPLGTNQDCTYLGAVITFSQAAGDTSEYEVYPIVGATEQSTSTTEELHANTWLNPQDYAVLLAGTLSDSNNNPNTDIPDESTQYNFTYGLTVYGVCSPNSATVSGAGIVINSQGEPNHLLYGGGLTSGTFQEDLYSFGTSTTDPWLNQVGNVNAALNASGGGAYPVTPGQVNYINIYLSNNTNYMLATHWAKLTINSGSGQLTTSLATYSSPQSPTCP
jgi:type II secretory pathway pseudopilin PulG